MMNIYLKQIERLNLELDSLNPDDYTYDRYCDKIDLIVEQIKLYNDIRIELYKSKALDEEEYNGEDDMEEYYRRNYK